MFNPTMFDNSRPDGFGVLEVVPGRILRASDPRLFVPLKRTELSGEVTGPLADLRLTQIFGYTADQCDKTLEAVYRFPLPGDAAVTGVTARFGERGDSRRTQGARARRSRLQRGQTAGPPGRPCHRESPDVFTLRIAGLQPDQEIRVETMYVQLARMEGQEWTLRIPLTTSPRYVREDEANSRHAQGQPLASSVTRGIVSPSISCCAIPPGSPVPPTRSPRLPRTADCVSGSAIRKSFPTGTAS